MSQPSRKRRAPPSGDRDAVEELNVADLNLRPRPAPGAPVAAGALVALARVPVTENLEGAQGVIGTAQQMQAAMGLSAADIAVQDAAFAAKMALGRFVKHDREAARAAAGIDAKR